MAAAVDDIVTSLSEWNVWWRGEGVPDDIKGRLRQVSPGLDDLLALRPVKTVTGIRRCGKSTYLYQVIDRLLGSGVGARSVLFVNFDDDALAGHGLRSVMDAYRSRVYPEGRPYLFLDEVHRCPGWVGHLRKLYDLRWIEHAFITDSSSHHLWGEYASVLTGRTVSVTVRPLSFAEHVAWRGIKVAPPLGSGEVNRLRSLLGEHLRWGGFPEVVLASSELRKRLLLGELVGSIIYKDVVERHRADAHKVRLLVDHVVSNPATVFSPRRFSRVHGLGLETVDSYMKHLQDVFLVHAVPRFDLSVSSIIRSPKKVYLADNGVCTALGLGPEEMRGRLFENAVFLELERRGYEVYYWSSARHECDFLLKRGRAIVGAVQACYHVDEGNEAREVGGVAEAMARFGLRRGTIVTEGEDRTERVGRREVRLVPLWRFLLEGEGLPGEGERGGEGGCGAATGRRMGKGSEEDGGVAPRRKQSKGSKMGKGGGRR